MNRVSMVADMKAGPADRPRRVFLCGGADEVRNAALSGLADAFGPHRVAFEDMSHAGFDGALEADCAIVFSAAGSGFSAESHALCCTLSVLRIPGIILAVSYGADSDFDAAEFQSLSADFAAFLDDLDVVPVACVPISGRGAALAAHGGPTLQTALEALPVPNGRHGMPFRMTVETVQRDGDDVRCTGRLLAGQAAVGAEIRVYPEGVPARIVRIVTDGGAIPDAAAEVVLAGPTAPRPGAILAPEEAAPSVADQVAARLIWFGREPMLPGRVYALDSGGHEATATVTALKHKLNVDTLEHQAAKTLGADEIALCNLSISRTLVFDEHGAIRELGRFRLIDRATDAVVGVGMIAFGLHRATNLKWQALDINKGARADLKGQRPCVLWFTGLSGAGKSTVANAVEQRLHATGRHTYILDGDNVRHGLNRDLGFTDADRVENIRRVAETARLMVDAGLIVMASFISPFRMERLMARELFDDAEFMEVFVDAPLDICEERDPKGLYKKARAGLVKNFTGIDSAYEPPEDPEFHLNAADSPADALAEQIVGELERRGIIGPIHRE